MFPCPGVPNPAGPPVGPAPPPPEPPERPPVPGATPDPPPIAIKFAAGAAAVIDEFVPFEPFKPRPVMLAPPAPTVTI